MAEDEEDNLGRYRDKVFKYTPPKDVGGPPLWVATFADDIWLGYTEPPKNLNDLTDKYRHMVHEGRAINRRLKMGEWLRLLKPSNEELLTQQVFLEMLDPVPYDELFDDTEETPEGQAVLEQVDMAAAVMEAGGACTICGIEPVEGHVQHKVGCYFPGFMIWRVLHPEDADRTPSLSMVIQAAQEQIARMQ